jgi:hypothetical protein
MAGSMGAGAICARNGELAANHTKKLSTRNGEVLLIVSPRFLLIGIHRERETANSAASEWANR